MYVVLVSGSLRLLTSFIHLPYLCASVCLPDNLSEVLLRLMRGDSIRLQIPLINLVSSTRPVHANELHKCIAAPVSAEKGNSLHEGK